MTEIPQHWTDTTSSEPHSALLVTTQIMVVHKAVTTVVIESDMDEVCQSDIFLA